MKKLHHTLTAILFAAFLCISIAPSTIFAEEAQGTFQFENLNDSTLKITLNNATASVDAHGNATVTDKLTGKSEHLPSKSKDKNENEVRLVYSKTEAGLNVKVLSISSATNHNLHTMSTQSVGKCILGTSGGAVTGAGTLGLGGAALGTVTIPGIGTVGGGIVGGIAGAVGGGLTGAAASCF